MNGLSTKVYLNFIPLGSYDFLIGMDCLGKHHVFLDLYNNAFTYLDEEGNLRTIQGIPSVVSIKEISALQLKISFKKCCQIYAAHMEEETKDKVPSIEDNIVLKYYEEAFREILWFPSKRDIDFSLNLMSGIVPINFFAVSFKLSESAIKIYRKGYNGEPFLMPLISLK